MQWNFMSGFQKAYAKTVGRDDDPTAMQALFRGGRDLRVVQVSVK